VNILIIVLIIIGAFILLLLAGGAFAFVATNSAAKSNKYKIGKDTVPSIKAVLDTRKVTRVSANTFNGITKKTYTYSNVENVEQDLIKYVTTLRQDNGFLTTKDFNLDTPSGTLELGKDSSESGKIILMDIQWDMGTYMISIRLGKGTLTKK
jgi:hypothetical protein